MGNPNEPRMREGEAHARRRLEELVGRYLPEQQSPAEVAAILLEEPDHPAYSGLIDVLDQRIVNAAQGHSPGITADERGERGGNWFMPDYLLGPGDEKLYGVLRDSNLLNAVAGRRPVESARDLEKANYRTLPDGNGKPIPLAYDPDVDPAFADRWRLSEAGHNYERAAADPTHHSTFFGGSPYPQHAMLGEPETLENNFERNGDGVLGQALSGFQKWTDASKRSARAPQGEADTTSHGQDNIPRYAAKWAGNFFGGEFTKAADEEWARNSMNRASPSVPNGVQDPALRRASIDNIKHFAGQAVVPEVKTYGESIGQGYSPALQWAFDMGHEFVDPITPAAAGVSVAARMPYAFGKGYPGILKALASEVPKAGAREVGEELVSPPNYAIGALTFPRSLDAFKGYKVSPEMQKDAGEKLRADTEKTDRALKLIREARQDY